MDVHLWYPADLWDYFHAPPTRDTPPRSTGSRLIPGRSWDPLSWSVASSSAREGPAIFRLAPKYPVIVFSHGNTNVPIDYAFTLEDLASAGFVVAAPNHVNNSQDDVRMDFANTPGRDGWLGRRFDSRCLRWSPLALLSCPGASRHGRPGAGHHRHASMPLPAELENRVDLDAGGSVRALTRDRHRAHGRGRSRGTCGNITPSRASRRSWGWRLRAPQSHSKPISAKITQRRCCPSPLGPRVREHQR